MNTIGNQLAAEWHHAEHGISDWFRRHDRHDATAAQPGDTITPDRHDQPQETTMSVPDAVAALKTNLETAAAALTTALGEDVPGLEGIGGQIDNSRIIQAAVAAEGVVPQAVLDAEASALDALTAAFTPAAPGVPDAPAEPAADQSAA